MLSIFKRIAKSFPQLKLKLKQAGMKEKPEEFVKKTAVTSFYITTAVVFLAGAIILKLKGLSSLLIIVYPIVFIFIFLYFMGLPDVLIARRKREINREIVFAGKFLIIEIGSGISLYNAMKNVSDNFKKIGKYFKEITDEVDLGTDIEDALNNSITYTPSENFRKLLWQIVNSLKTGSDLERSVNAILDQVTREQKIEIEKYGKKLNPLAMFYMMIAIIIPSLGTTMLVVLSTFFSFEIKLVILLSIAFFLAFIQFMFLAIIKSSRPAVDL